MAPRPRRQSKETMELRASFVEHARRIVDRDGPGALTMRALAAEAGCAVGLAYKVFESREELVVEVLRAEFRRLGAGLERLVAGAGTGTVADGLATYAELLLGSPSIALMEEVEHDEAASRAILEDAADSGLVTALESALEAYLEAERWLGRVDPSVDAGAFAFLIAGAVHNLLYAGPMYPRPSMPELRRIFEAVAARLAPAGGEEGGEGGAGISAVPA